VAAEAAASFCGGGGFLPEKTDKSMVIRIFEAQLYFLTHLSETKLTERKEFFSEDFFFCCFVCFADWQRLRKEKAT
jgi:hypothetical protein